MSRSGRLVLTVSVLVLVLVGGGASAAQAATLTEVSHIWAGDAHTCARLVNGQVRCWGRNTWGQVGDGTTDDRGSAVVVRNALDTRPLRRVEKIAGGADHSCAILTSGQVRCWGLNLSGQLGDGTKVERHLPVSVMNASGSAPLGGVVDIAAGSSHTCALLGSGRIRCWGSNLDGQLGDGTKAERLRPTLVKSPSGGGPLTGVVGLDAGLGHTCALLSSGQVRCWGDNVHGKLGDGTEEERLLPVGVRKSKGPGRLTGVTRIELGDYHSCARLDSGQARCWGYNFDGELGDGTIENRSRPVAVKNGAGTGPLRGVSGVSAGGSNTCARLSTGRAMCWGDYDSGQLGDGSTGDYSSLPVGVRTAAGSRLENVAQLVVGFEFACARLKGGVVRCWGTNADGQLGDGTFSESHRPVPVVK